MNSNMASERSALVNPSSSCWSMIFSNPSIRKSKLISFCLTSARPLIKSAMRNSLSNYMTMVRGPALKWVKEFLDNRHQSVIVNGSSSEPIPVSTVVPQGSMLGPLLFLIYINDLPMNVKSKVRLFADDAALYLTISTSSQSEILKKDLDNLERWGHKWDMNLIPLNATSFT